MLVGLVLNLLFIYLFFISFSSVGVMPFSVCLSMLQIDMEFLL